MRCPLMYGLVATLAISLPVNAALVEADWKVLGDGLLTVDTDTGLDIMD